MNLSDTSLKFADSIYDAIGCTECDGEFVPRGTMYLIGNGGSAAICSHIANDAIKGGKNAFALTDSSVLTCLANDYGYEHVYTVQLERLSPDATLIAISSSGQSQNILNAAAWANGAGMEVVTFSGFSNTNPLRSLGHINYWVPSYNYGIVEIAHLTILHSLVNPGV